MTRSNRTRETGAVHGIAIAAALGVGLLGAVAGLGGCTTTAGFGELGQTEPEDIDNDKDTEALGITGDSGK